VNWPLGALIGHGGDLLMCSKKDDFAIEAIELSKCYRLYNKPSERLKQAMPWQKEKLYREFWALRDINFRLDRGKTLGVIGRNGSGKSTLLQLICGTLTPTTGRVKINGRIGALLELGSGFNPEFTGLENVRMNAAVLGLKEKEIKNKLEAILEFAGIGEFINQPVKQYSSGMVVRLAFAVQAHIDPTILVVDEALAVGDELFQKKCFARLEKLKQAGTSILLVSHSCAQINQHCDQVLLLHKGQPKLMGDPHRVTALYQRLGQASDEEWNEVIKKEEKEYNEMNYLHNNSDEKTENREENQYKQINNKIKPHLDKGMKAESTITYPAKGITIELIEVTTEAGDPINTMPHGTDFKVIIKYKCEKSFEAIRFGCFIANNNGAKVTGQSFPNLNRKSISAKKNEISLISFNYRGGLWPGYYFIGAGVAEANSSGLFLHRIIDAVAIRIIDDKGITQIGNVDLTKTISDV